MGLILVFKGLQLILPRRHHLLRICAAHVIVLIPLCARDSVRSRILLLVVEVQVGLNGFFDLGPASVKRYLNASIGIAY